MTKEKCPDCNGTGVEYIKDKETGTITVWLCSTCSGTGKKK